MTTVMCCGKTGETMGGHGSDPTLNDALKGLQAAVKKLGESVSKFETAPATTTPKRDVAKFMTPPRVGPNGELIKGSVIEVERERPHERQFAPPVPLFSGHVEESDRQTKVWLRAGGPLYELKLQLDAVRRLADDRYASARARGEAGARAQALESQINRMLEDISAGRRDIDGNLV